MEEGNKPGPFDEFEMLLGEIPNATYNRNPNLDEQGPFNSINDFKITPFDNKFCTDRARPLYVMNSPNNNLLKEQTISVNKFQMSPIKRVQVQPIEPNSLPDINTLTSKFAELSPISGVGVEAANPPLVNYTSLLSPSPLSDLDYPYVVHSFPSKVDGRVVAQGFQLPASDFEFSADHQQYSSELQSSYPYLHHQQVNQSHITQRQIEEERQYRMHQQHYYMYHQQLCNQQLEAMHPIQANRNSARHLSRKPTQLCFEMSHQLEQFNQEPRSNNFDSTCFNRFNHAISSRDFSSMQAHFPEEILTKSQGLNSFRDVKVDSIGRNESPHHANNPGCYSYYDSFTASSKSHSQKYNSLYDVLGRIYVMARDQHGCRFLQRKISEGSQNDVKRVFYEIIDHIVELMTDPFGNYLVQKLLEVCDEDQRTQILVVITRNDVDLVRISCDMHGTRAVQKVVETLRTPEQFSMLVSSLKLGVVTLIKNMNGNHVAQRCLQYLVPEYKEFLFEAVTNHCVELGTDRHGCCVLQKALLHSDGNQRHRLIYDIVSNALILSQDPYGNYVVQYIFELQLPWAALDILHQLEGKYRDLSVQKYSSNVVEKCLRYANEDGRLQIIQELMSNPHLDQIMQDPYGNYVIQAALKNSKGALNAALVEAIAPHVPLLRTSPYGKKVLSKNKLKK